jgi:hypothetical protein
MSDLIPFEFQGDRLMLVDVDGKPHIVLKHAFDAIGLDADRQIRNVRAREWARTAVTAVHDASGRVQQMVTADVRTFLMALATIPAGRVAEPVRPKLVAYQSEVADAIEAYWTQGGVINPRATEDQLASIIGRAESQARVLAALKGIVDKSWLERKPGTSPPARSVRSPTSIRRPGRSRSASTWKTRASRARRCGRSRRGSGSC